MYCLFLADLAERRELERTQCLPNVRSKALVPGLRLVLHVFDKLFHLLNYGDSKVCEVWSHSRPYAANPLS